MRPAKGEILNDRVVPELSFIREFFSRQRSFPELRNPHVEALLDAESKKTAVKSSVLIPLIEDQHSRVLVTRRQADIRFAGHWCFPGGCSEPSETAVETALREAEEEISLIASDIEVLGCLGDYYTQSGYQITPVVGIVQHPANVVADPSEVDLIREISLARLLDSCSYQLTWHNKARAHYSFSESGIRIAGPTVSLMIGLFESLAKYASRSSHQT